MRIYIITLLIILMNVGGYQMADGKEGEVHLGQRDSKLFFEKLNKDNMYLVDEFYAEDVQFLDPIVNLKSRGDIKHYYSSSYEGVKEISFVVSKVIQEENEEVLIWTMNMTAKKLNKGKPIIVEGSSHIRYNDQGKAIYHRDYFDMGAMIYKNVPIVRGMVKYVNKRMRKMHDKTYD